MSETASSPIASQGGGTVAPVPAATPGLPVAFATFAASLRPRAVPLVRNGRPVLFRGRQAQTALPGHADELWLKLLRIRHGVEKHTAADWHALIDAMRDEPAHPSDPRYVAGTR
jgi:hypothetical protein